MVGLSSLKNTIAHIKKSLVPVIETTNPATMIQGKADTRTLAPLRKRLNGLLISLPNSVKSESS